MVPRGFMRFGLLCFTKQFSKKKHRLASTASNRKVIKIKPDISWFYQETLFYKTSKWHQKKLNSRTWMTLKSSLVIFDLRYQLKIGFLIIPYTKRVSYWSIWCQGWSNHQDEETFWGNRAVEAVEASEVAEADEVNEAAEVSKGSKITTEDFRVIQVLEFSFFWCYFDVLKNKVSW